MRWRLNTIPKLLQLGATFPSEDHAQGAVLPFAGSGGAVYASSFTSMAVVGCNFTKNQVLAGCSHCLSHTLSQGSSAHCALKTKLIVTGAAELRVHTARRSTCTEGSQAAFLVFGAVGWVHQVFGMPDPTLQCTAICLATEAPGVQSLSLCFFRQRSRMRPAAPRAARWRCRLATWRRWTRATSAATPPASRGAPSQSLGAPRAMPLVFICSLAAVSIFQAGLLTVPPHRKSTGSQPEAPSHVGQEPEPMPLFNTWLF